MKKSFGEYVNDRFKFLIYPLLIWGSIQITLQLVFSKYVNADREMMDYLNLIIRPRKIEQFWYLNTLFVVGVVYAFFKAILKMNMWQLMFSALICYASAAVFYVAYDQRTDDSLEFLAYSFIPDFLHFYIYFYIGDLCSQYIMKKENQVHFSSYVVLIPVFIVFLVAHYFFTVINLEKDSDTYVQHFMPVLFLGISLTGCALMIQVSFILQKLNIMKVLRVIGYHSLHIYVSHLIIISAIRIFFVHLLNFTDVPTLIIISVIAGIILPVILYNILVRSGMWWLYTLKKPRNEIKYYHSKLAMGS
jgi:fucose 4-O-acetylase-like acetyltransferase